MPSEATRNMFLVAGGFGIGALVVLAGFAFLIGIGGIETQSVSPAAQSAAHSPTSPGPAPQPAPATAGTAVETTGKAPAPANPDTPRATIPEQPPAVARPDQQNQPK